VYRAYKALGEGSNEPVQVSYRVFRKDGTYIRLETDARPFVGAGDYEREIVCVSRHGRDRHPEATEGEAHVEETPEVEVEERAQPPRGRFPTDKLTGVRKRSHMDDLLGTRVVSRRSANFPFGVLLVDVDNFAALNDRYGQAAGNAILKRVAGTLLDTCRGEDIVGRGGDDEFLVILPNTGPGGTIVVGERLVRNVRAIDWSDIPLESPVTISIGATCITYGSYVTLPELMGILHDQLTQAKETGRDRLVMNAKQTARYWDSG
jgi:diguanylate cyclase (GGDEF)-like protein